MYKIITEDLELLKYNFHCISLGLILNALFVVTSFLATNSWFDVKPIIIFDKSKCTSSLVTSNLYLLYKKVEYNLVSLYEQMYNGNVVVYTTSGKIVHMLYEKKTSIQNIYNLPIFCMKKDFMSIQHIEKSLYVVWKKRFHPFNIWTICP